jgi:tetratricopeptide (TPR) repeat protein
LGFAGLLALAWLAYSPGLSGGFLFDDFVNLDALGATGKIDDWPTFWRFVTSGSADPIGRPLSLLTFLLDAQDWPADPYPFLRTNLALHLLNGGLLFILIRRLENRLGTESSPSAWIATLAAGAWLLHPLFVSTTLYIVQREAMLPATFTLLGLIAYLHGRGQADAGNARSALVWMLAGIGGGTALATLCKANGLLLPMLAWILDASGTRHVSSSSRSVSGWMTASRTVLLVAPTIALGIWLISKLPSAGEIVAAREWTVAERLLTEPRVMVDYLWLLAAPRAISTGLYNDAYQASTNWLHPWTTLPCILLVVFLVGFLFLKRREAPRLATAGLFFFGAHVLESTVIPLELYFEHRNYLPAMLLAWPLAALCFVGNAWRPKRAGAYALWLFLLTVILLQRTTLWGNQDALYAAWGKANPTSPRAVATRAMTEARLGNLSAASQMLDSAWRKDPAELQLALNYVDTTCSGSGLAPSDANRVKAALRLAQRGDGLLLPWLGKAIGVAERGACPGLTLSEIDGWLDALTFNEVLIPPSSRAASIEPLRAQVALARGDADGALSHFDSALAARPGPSVAAGQAALLASSGYYDQALAHLDFYASLSQPSANLKGMAAVHEWVLTRQNYWSAELTDLRRRIIAARNSRPDQ